MELSWSTFLLEMFNFLVLIWILKHFLYKPVLGVIAKRQEGVEKTLSDAKALNDEAEKLKQQYEVRLEHWQQERQRARDNLSRELDAERAQKMSALEDTLEQEREKVRVAETQRQADAQRKVEEGALAQGARFVGKLLSRVASPEIENRLIELTIAELEQLPPERLATLLAHNGAPSNTITVTSAYPVKEQQLEQVLSHNGWTSSLQFKEDPTLLAGLHITMGAWVLAANLRDELHGFSELSRHEQ